MRKSRRSSSSRRVTTTRTRTSPRRRPARNRRRFSFKRLIRPLIYMVLLCLLGVGGYYLLTTPELKIDKVVVKGTHLLDETVVEADAKSSLGQNILILSKKPILVRIMRHPEVKDVVIGRLLPKTVVVKVEERNRFAIVTNGSGFWFIDKKGFPFYKVEQPSDSVPLIMLDPSIQVKTGVAIKHVAVKAAIDCLEVARPILGRVDKISVDPNVNLCLNIGSDFYVKLGQPVELHKKIVTLHKILDAPPNIGKKAQYVDVSCSDRPVLKPKTSGDSINSTNNEKTD